jgi:hypothetical protein
MKRSSRMTWRNYWPYWSYYAQVIFAICLHEGMTLEEASQATEFSCLWFTGFSSAGEGRLKNDKEKSAMASSLSPTPPR